MPSKSYSGQKASWGLKVAALGTLLFLHVPIWIIFLYTLTPDETTYTFPLPGITFKWFGVALQRPDLCAHDALQCDHCHSCRIDLGTLKRSDLCQISSEGTHLLSTCPSYSASGHCDGIALRSAVVLSILILLLADRDRYTTFCGCRYNNVIARFRRSSGSLVKRPWLGANSFGRSLCCLSKYCHRSLQADAPLPTRS
jgi:putative spermidine/putrescine transport system permease protein